MMGLFYKDRMAYETTNNDYMLVPTCRTGITFVNVITLILILLVFGGFDTEEDFSSGQIIREKKDRYLSEDSLSAFNAEEIPTETLPYLYLLILAEILNRVQDEEYKKSDHKSGNREKDKGISSTGFEDKCSPPQNGIQNGIPLIPLIESQFAQEVDNMNNSYKFKKNNSESNSAISEKDKIVIPSILSEVGEILKPGDASNVEENTSAAGGGHGCIAESHSDYKCKFAEEQLTNVPSIIRNEYRGIKITAMLPTGILVTGEVVFNFKDIIALKCEHTIVFIKEKDIIAFY
jgi:hypothetical protein